VQRVGGDPGGEALARGGVEGPAEDGALLVGRRVLEDEALEVNEGMGPGGRVTAPPGRRGREREVLAEHHARRPRQVGAERGVLEDAAAEGVDDGDMTGAHRADQAGDAEA